MTFTFANLSRYTFLNLHEGKIYTHVPVLLVEKLKITISLLCPRGSIYLTRCNQNMKKKKKKRKEVESIEQLYEPMTNCFAISRLTDSCNLFSKLAR